MTAKCPNLEALFIQHVQTWILRDAFDVKKNAIDGSTLYNDLILKFCHSLRWAKKLYVLRCIPYSL